MSAEIFSSGEVLQITYDEMLDRSVPDKAHFTVSVTRDPPGKTEAERLNIFNGLLLSALWDAAFDRGLVTFGDDGRPKFAADLGEAARLELRWHQPVALTDKHRERLAWHRAELFVESK